MFQMIFPVLLMGLEFFLKRGKASEEEWKAYKNFVNSSRYWSKLPSGKRMKVEARWIRIEDKRKKILKKMKDEGKI